MDVSMSSVWDEHQQSKNKQKAHTHLIENNRILSLLLEEAIILFLKDFHKHIGIMVRAFANGLGNLGSIPGRVIPKTQKMVLDDTLLNIQHYKVRIKGKVEQSRERSSTLPYTLV